MNLQITMLDYIKDPATYFVKFELSNGTEKTLRLTEQDCITNRASITDLVQKLAEEFAESEGLKNVRILL